jgi:molybdate transport system permease protein
MNSERPPRTVIVVAAIAAMLFVLPLVGVLWRMPWSSAWSLLTAPESRSAFRLSLITSFGATALVVVLGTPLAWLLARTVFPGRRLLRGLVILPMVLPPLVGGIALLYAFGRRGIVGRYLDSWFGITLPFSTAGAVLAAAFVAMPFFVITVEAALRSTDPRLEEAARTLRADTWTRFRRVTLPLIRPALVAGTVLAWARALGEFGATITFAGNFPGRTQTLPLAAFMALETDPESAIVLAGVLVVISVGVLVAMRDRWLGSL